MHLIEHPCIPFSTPIYEGFSHDSKVHIHGHSFHGPEEHFVVEFFAGPDIALHIVFGFGCDPHIRINSMVGGCWQHEERHHNHVCVGEHFHLKIKNEHHHFKIKVNGHDVCKFHHRIPAHAINSMGIRGAIDVHKIHFEDFHHHNHGGGFGGYPGSGVYPTPGLYPGQGAYPAPVMMAPPPVVVVEEGHHHGHHHHHHGILHDLFHPHHHHHHHH
uniref:Galectin n=1 Tax=Panagrellus redivivus TaxID=6233 RepID=A0A7E4V637_PANRE